MGYLKQRFLEGISRGDETEKQLDEMINCQIEDAKIKRSEIEGGAGVLGWQNKNNLLKDLKKK